MRKWIILCALLLSFGCAKEGSILDSNIPKVESGIIPTYRYSLLAFEGWNLEKGDMLILRVMAANMDVTGKGQYQGVLYRLPN